MIKNYQAFINFCILLKYKNGNIFMSIECFNINTLILLLELGKTMIFNYGAIR